MTLEAKVAVRDGVVAFELSGEYRREEHTARSDEFRKMIREQWTNQSQPLRVLFDLRRVTGELKRESGYFNITREWGEATMRKFAWLYSDPAKRIPVPLSRNRRPQPRLRRPGVS